MQLKSHCACADHTAEFTELASVVKSARTITRSAQIQAGNYGKAVPHTWHVVQQNKFTVHPVVLAMLKAHRPAVMVDLMFEWPHVSEKDGAMLAYTRDDAKGETDVQTLTSIGKYVARHWPKVPDHVRRDACLLFTPEKMLMVEPTTEAIIHGVQNGPTSCMKGDWNVHPYSVYSPALGWGMAVRLNSDGRIDGRALTWTDPDDKDRRIFARTYARNKDDPEGGYSQADQMLAAWLEAQGFSHEDWPEGARLAKFTHRGGDPLLPYIDGDNQHVRDDDDTWIICDGDDDAEYLCDNTNGTADEVGGNTCEDCDDRMSGDDRCTVGRDEARQVCDSCCGDRYTYVTGTYGYGSRNSEYYVRNHDATCVGGSWYDTENLPDNIVELHDGDYADIDDCCCVDDEWYLSEDCVCCADGETQHLDDCTMCADGEYRLSEDCVECADGESYSIDDCAECADDLWRMIDDCTECTDDGKFYPTDDCWECEHSGEWYSNKVEHVELDEQMYHPDSVAEMRAETQVAPLFQKVPTAWPFVETRETATA